MTFLITLSNPTCQALAGFSQFASLLEDDKTRKTFARLLLGDARMASRQVSMLAGVVNMNIGILMVELGTSTDLSSDSSSVMKLFLPLSRQRDAIKSMLLG